MLKFIGDEDQYVAVKHNNADVKHTYYVDYYKSYSLIDPFLVTKTIYNYVEKSYCLCEEVDNVSDHCPIIIQLKIDLKKNMKLLLLLRSEERAGIWQ